MPERIELMSDAPSRRTIDASWSKKQKLAAGVGCGVLALGALGFGGFSWWANPPVEMPTSADQAIAMINSGRVDNLDEARRRQYMTETRRLLADMPREEARELFRDEKTREAMMEVWEAAFDEASRRFARGEGLMQIWQDMSGGRRGGPPRGKGRGEGRGEGREGAPEREELTEEEREARQRERREMMTSRMQASFQSGNAQNTGLRGEFFKRMSAFKGMRGMRGGGGDGANRGRRGGE